MRRPPHALASLLVLGLAGSPCAAQVNGDTPLRLYLPPLVHGQSLATQHTETLDTLWVGHTTVAPSSGAPQFVGVGPALPHLNDDGMWTWDRFRSGENDSLQQWWPIRRAYGYTAGMTVPDNLRPWWAIDIGNQANYVLRSRHQARTFGVIGVWHVDGGALDVDPNITASPSWMPLDGVGSAWCGLRAHSDRSYKDPITNNYFNQNVLDYDGDNPTALTTLKRFPGYAGQWDQMLYRDIPVASGSAATISFEYRTTMSTGADLAAATRTGWFDKDPTAVTAGNFISSTAAGANAPVDSFMVYIGVPANPSACTHADGSVTPIFDVQRRWFSEVIDITKPYIHVVGFAGNQAGAFSASFPNAVIQPLVNAQTGPAYLRVVFRNKTNSKFDDGSPGYSSGTAGAVLIDDVNVTAGANAFSSGFESPSEIDNTPTPGGISVSSWKSTGKPPDVYFHTHPLLGGGTFSPLAWNDVNGPPGSPNRLCNEDGVVISAGDHDHSERFGGDLFSPDEELRQGMISPTINLIVPASGTNGVGLDVDAIDNTGTRDYQLRYDLYTADVSGSCGQTWGFGVQSYPALQSNGQMCWGEIRDSPFQLFSGPITCITDVEQLYANGLISTSNSNGIPDSIRIYLGTRQACFEFTCTLGCSPSGGAYFDNVSVGFEHMHHLPATAVAGTGTIAVDIASWFSDAFPANETPGLPGTAAFDTAAALVKSGLNIAEGPSGSRPDIPGDTLVARSLGNGVRMDLVFRILPGPGNYVTMGNRASGLRKDPAHDALATPGDDSFWGQYLSSNDGGSGFGTPGAHALGVWSPDDWNAARCDTAEINLFPVESIGNLPRIVPGYWASMYHEADPKFTTLGIPKPRCFLVDTLGVVSSSNITCGTGTYPPAWVTTLPGSRTGWDGTTTTREYTKIIPDGLLTPGSHVEYFLRRSDVSAPNAYVLQPDTSYILRSDDIDRDGDRWQSFSVLPDAWKFAAYGGLGGACMLFVDLADRRGDERAWVGIADSIGATSAARYGAGKGWHVQGNLDYLDQPVGVLGAYTYASNPDPDHRPSVWKHLGQVGSMWDMYGVKGGEALIESAGDIGGRLATAPSGFATGKGARLGPTPEMLRTYYRMIFLSSADVSAGVLGPYAGRSQNDVSLIEDFLSNAAGSATPRVIFAEGSGFAASETNASDPNHATLLHSYLGTMLRDPSYSLLSGNGSLDADLLPASVVDGGRGDCFGVNLTRADEDVLQPNPAISGAVAGSYFQNVGVNGPYVAGVYAPASGSRPWVSMVDGFSIQEVTNRFGTRNSARQYYLDAFTNVFASMCALSGPPIADAPGLHGALAPFLRLRNVPDALGPLGVAFSVPSRDRVRIEVFDVMGRRARLLVDGPFAAGEHQIAWDGLTDSGAVAARGMYMVRIRYDSNGRTLAQKAVIVR